MERPKEFKLSAAFRLPSSGDTLGMPLFTTPNANHYWSVETDDFLRIRRFTPFTREIESIQLIEAGEAMALFRKGDYAPIPLWLLGDVRVVPGGVGREDFELDLRSEHRNRPVVTRLGSILSRARRKQIAAQSESEDFWHSFRFLSQNFSGGGAWIRKLGAVLRQCPAYLRADSLELDELREIIWQWSETYIGRVSVDRFEEFIVAIQGSPQDILNRDLIVAVAFIERLLTGGQKLRVLEIAVRLDLPKPAEARVRLLADWSHEERARRLAYTFEAKLSAEVQRCFDVMERRDVLGYFEAEQDFIVVVDVFGRVLLPNWISYSMPRYIRSNFERMAIIQGNFYSGRDSGATEGELESCKGEFEVYLLMAETFARMVGGEESVSSVHSAYKKFSGNAELLSRDGG